MPVLGGGIHVKGEASETEGPSFRWTTYRDTVEDGGDYSPNVFLWEEILPESEALAWLEPGAEMDTFQNTDGDGGVSLAEFTGTSTRYLSVFAVPGPIASTRPSYVRATMTASYGYLPEPGIWRLELVGRDENSHEIGVIGFSFDSNDPEAFNTGGDYEITPYDVTVHLTLSLDYGTYGSTQLAFAAARIRLT